MLFPRKVSVSGKKSCNISPTNSPEPEPRKAVLSPSLLKVPNKPGTDDKRRDPGEALHFLVPQPIRELTCVHVTTRRRPSNDVISPGEASQTHQTFEV